MGSGWFTSRRRARARRDLSLSNVYRYHTPIPPHPPSSERLVPSISLSLTSFPSRQPQIITSRPHSSQLRVFPSQELPQLRDLVFELKTVTCIWHSLGVQLGVPYDRLDKIDEDYQSADRKLNFHEVLSYWLLNEGNPSWDKMCEALQRVGGFGCLILNSCSQCLTHPLLSPAV